MKMEINLTLTPFQLNPLKTSLFMDQDAMDQDARTRIHGNITAVVLRGTVCVNLFHI